MDVRLKKPQVPGTTPLLRGARPTCEAHFYRWQKVEPQVVKLDASSTLGGNFSNTAKERPVMVVNNDIIRATAQKDKGSHAGQFTLLLKAGKVGVDSETFSTRTKIDYCEAVNPGDWVIIYIGKSTGPNVDKSQIKMLGIVERVQLQEIDNPGNGAPTQVYVITGKDFGKVFEAQLYSSPIMASKTGTTLYGADFLANSLKAVAGAKGTLSPDNIMKALVSYYYGGAYASTNKEHELWYVPPSLAAYFGINIQTKTKPSFIDILDYQSHVGLQGANGTVKGTLPGEIVIRTLPTSGTVWDVMSYYSNAAINEMYCDLDFTGTSIRPSLTFRQIPYSVASGNLKIPTSVSESQRTFLHALRKTTLNSSAVKGKNISKADAERVNHIVVVPRADTPFPTAYKSTINPTSVQQFGLRSLTVETPYAATSQQSFDSYCETCVNLLTEWFFNSENYYSGTLTIEGLDTHVPVGSNLYLEDIGQLFHVEGYTHTYEQVKEGVITFVTDFSVIRGCSANQTALNRIETVQSTTVVKSILENIPKRVQDGR